MGREGEGRRGEERQDVLYNHVCACLLLLYVERGEGVSDCHSNGRRCH